MKKSFLTFISSVMAIMLFSCDAMAIQTKEVNSIKKDNFLSNWWRKLSNKEKIAVRFTGTSIFSLAFIIPLYISSNNEDETGDIIQKLDSYLKSQGINLRMQLENDDYGSMLEIPIIKIKLREILTSAPQMFRGPIQKILDELDNMLARKNENINSKINERTNCYNESSGTIRPLDKHKFRRLLNKYTWNEGNGFIVLDKFFDVNVKLKWRNETIELASVGNGGLSNDCSGNFIIDKNCGLYKKIETQISKKFANYMARSGELYRYSLIPVEVRRLFELFLNLLENEPDLKTNFNNGAPFNNGFGSIKSEIDDALKRSACYIQAQNLILEMARFADEYFWKKENPSAEDGKDMISKNSDMILTSFREQVGEEASKLYPCPRGPFAGGQPEYCRALRHIWSQGLGNSANEGDDGSKRDDAYSQYVQLADCVFTAPGDKVLVFDHTCGYSAEKVASVFKLHKICDMAKSNIFNTIDEDNLQILNAGVMENYKISFKDFCRLVSLSYNKDNFEERFNAYLENPNVEAGEEKTTLENWKKGDLELSLSEIKQAVYGSDCNTYSEHMSIPETVDGIGNMWNDKKQIYYAFTVYPFYLRSEGKIL